MNGLRGDGFFWLMLVVGGLFFFFFFLVVEKWFARGKLWIYIILPR